LEAQLIKARLLRRQKDEAGAEAILRRLAEQLEAHPLQFRQVRTQAGNHGRPLRAKTAMGLIPGQPGSAMLFSHPITLSENAAVVKPESSDLVDPWP